MLNDEGIDAVVIGLDPHFSGDAHLAETDVRPSTWARPAASSNGSPPYERFRKPLIAVVDGGAQFELLP